MIPAGSGARRAALDEAYKIDPGFRRTEGRLTGGPMSRVTPLLRWCAVCLSAGKASRSCLGLARAGLGFLARLPGLAPFSGWWRRSRPRARAAGAHSQVFVLVQQDIPLNLNYLSRTLEHSSDCVLCREGSITLASGGVSCLEAGHLPSIPSHVPTAERSITSSKSKLVPKRLTTR